MKLVKSGVGYSLLFLLLLLGGAEKACGMNKIGVVLAGFTLSTLVVAEMAKNESRLHEISYRAFKGGRTAIIFWVLAKMAHWFVKETIRIRKLNANTEKTKQRIKKIKKETEEIEKKCKKKKEEGDEFKKRTDPIVKELDDLNEKIKKEIHNDPFRKMLFEHTADQMKKETKKRDRENANGSSVKFEEWSDKDKEFKLL